MACGKLVRDGLAGRLAGRGLRVRRAGPGELERLLREKIVEEALELAESGDPEEAADLLEALRAWLEVRGLSLERALRLADEKRAARGGFGGGFVVEWEC